jgi:hypothetical protein
MGDLIKDVGYSKVTKLIEILDQYNVNPDNLEVFRKASSWKQRTVARIHKFDSFLWAMLEMEQTLGKAGFLESDLKLLAGNEEKIKRVLKIAREGTENPQAVIQLLDSIVRVDRTIRPTYPDWKKKVLFPKLENFGPSEFDAAKLELWIHKGQKNGGRVKGQIIFEYLKKEKMLGNCLGLRDLEEIKKKRIDFFRKYFRDKAIFGWKSVVQGRGGDLSVPYLYDGGYEVVLDWYWLEYGWSGNCPGLRLAS